jgi:two-component system response regulator YesN
MARIEKSKELLAMGEMSIGEVAEICGYNNLSYFSKIFRLHTGVTPSEYIAEGRNREEKREGSYV